MNFSWRQWLRILPPAECFPLSIKKARRPCRGYHEIWSEVVKQRADASAKRSRLPSRRASVTFDFEMGSLHYRATISHFPAGGCVAEIFLSNNKSGSQADANARDAAVVASLAFQYTDVHSTCFGTRSCAIYEARRRLR
jgi:hypothetical protein